MFPRDPYNPLHCCTTIAVEEIKDLGRWMVHRVTYKKDVLTECLSRTDATQSSACTSTQFLLHTTTVKVINYITRTFIIYLSYNEPYTVE